MSGLIPPTRAPGDNGPRDEPQLLAWERERRDTRPHVLTMDLSRSELDVLEDAANGMTMRQSAFSRSKSPETVKSQRTSVLAKLGARNMVQAVAITVRERQIANPDIAPIRFA
ncbi:MAG: Bacterial regulatory protein luxR family [Gaiellales bacterium]|jgi:DNA-binding NarL/FixJ family response regulator|nr:Bacterial regulatory protein luxR family [Gaiellales bacterium]